jgi:hypothetical protein
MERESATVVKPERKKAEPARPAASVRRVIQLKKTVSEPRDASEIEADRVASNLEQGVSAGAISPARTESSQLTPGSIDHVLGGPGSPLAPATRAYFEQRLNSDFSSVRVHTDSAASESARQIQARAYTTGQHIVFRSGEFSPNTSGGGRLLAHELTHVVQQSRGQDIVQRDGDGDVKKEEKKDEAAKPADNAAQAPGGDAAAGGNPTDAAEQERVAGIVASTEDERQMVRALSVRPKIQEIQKTSHRKAMEVYNNDPNATLDDLYGGKYDDEQKAKDEVEIQALLDDVGVVGMLEFHKLEEKFPGVFQTKAYNLATYMLDQNERIAKKESERYLESEGIKPDSDIVALQQAAGDIAGMAAKIIARYDEVRTKRYQEPDPTSSGHQAEREEIRWSSQLQGNPALNYYAGEDVALQEMLAGYQDRINIAGGRFPILLTPHLNFEFLGQTDAAGLEKLIKGRAGEVLDNIKEARGKMTAEKIWELPIIIDRTKQVLGVRAGEGAEDLLKERMETIGSDKMMSNMLVMALGIGFGLVAAAGTGGLALLALVGGAAVSTYSAAQHWSEYSFQRAASDSAIDPAQVISKDDPSLLWLAVDLIAAGLDIGAAAIAFRNMARAFAAAVKTEKALEELREIARAQYKALPSGHTALSEEQFIERMVGSVKKGLAPTSGDAMKQIAVVKEIVEGTSPRVTAILVNGDEAAMQAMIKEHGNWKELINALQHSTPEAQKVAKELEGFRNGIVAEMQARGAAPVGGASTKSISDVDFNVGGGDAGAKVLAFEKEMAERFGENWSQSLRMNFYTEASRLTMYEEVMKGMSPGARKELLARLTAQTEDLTFAKMLEHAHGNPEALERIERMMKATGKGGDLEKLKALAMTPAAHAAERSKLLVEIDALVKEFKATPSPELAERIASKQMVANFHSMEAYIGPGAGRMTVGGVPVAGQEAYQSALSDLEMMEHILHQSGGSLVSAGREYEFYKYVNRYATAARNAGVHSDRLTYFEHLSEYLYRRARGAHGETAHLEVPGGLLDEASQVKVTDAFVTQQIKEFQQEVEATLPRIMDSAKNNPNVWVSTPIKKQLGYVKATEEFPEAVVRPIDMSGAKVPVAKEPPGLFLALQGHALSNGWIDAATRLEAIEKVVKIHLDAIQRVTKGGGKLKLTAIAAGKVVGKAIAQEAGNRIDKAQSRDLTHITIVVESDGNGGFRVAEAYPE